jgi:hypothetical protein
VKSEIFLMNDPCPDITIYATIESPCRVDKKYAVSKFFLSDFWPKKPKNSVKIGNLKVLFEFYLLRNGPKWSNLNSLYDFEVKNILWFGPFRHQHNL